jgi:hypothetical protein
VLVEDGNAPLFQVQLGSLIDGVPTVGRVYEDLATLFQIDRVNPATERVLPTLTIENNLSYDLDIVDTVTNEIERVTSRKSEVTGLIITNPFREADMLRRHLRSAVEKEHRLNPRHQVYDPAFEVIASYDQCYVDLESTHHHSENHTYDLESISLQNLSGVVPTQDICNIALKASW